MTADEPRSLGSKSGNLGLADSTLGSRSGSGTRSFGFLGDETMAADAAGRLVGASEASVHLPIGAVINGRYQIQAVLGEGGMGVVYKVADQLHPERQVALKTIRGQSWQEDDLALFKAEFAIMTKLRHPNLATVYDFELMQGTDDYCFTMDYVDGQDLFHATEGASWQEVVDLVVQVGRALAYVHTRQVVHFDLKPANVFVTADRKAKVLDFGLAGA